MHYCKHDKADVNYGLVVKLALPAKVTRRANKLFGIYDRSH
jgi:hypothetical protein